MGGLHAVYLLGEMASKVEVADTFPIGEPEGSGDFQDGGAFAPRVGGPLRGEEFWQGLLENAATRAGGMDMLEREVFSMVRQAAS